MKNSITSKALTTLIPMALFPATSQASILFYEGFSDASYTAGSIDGQSFVGEGYAEGGSWNTSNVFLDGGLTVPSLETTPGLSLNRSSGEIIANLDTSPGGPFGTAGLVGSDGMIGGAGITNSVYFSVLARRDDSQGASFAGFQVFEGSSEGFGVGEVGNPTNHTWLRAGGNGLIGEGTPLLPEGTTNLYVFRLDFNEAGTTDAQVWINPDITLTEGDQANTSFTDVTNANTTPSGGFDNLRIRGSREYTYDEIRIGTTWESVTPTLIPEPSGAVLSVIALSAFAFRRGRRR